MRGKKKIEAATEIEEKERKMVRGEGMPKQRRGWVGRSLIKLKTEWSTRSGVFGIFCGASREKVKKRFRPSGLFGLEKTKKWRPSALFGPSGFSKIKSTHAGSAKINFLIMVSKKNPKKRLSVPCNIYTDASALCSSARARLLAIVHNWIVCD